MAARLAARLVTGPAAFAVAWAIDVVAYVLRTAGRTGTSGETPSLDQ